MRKKGGTRMPTSKVPRPYIKKTVSVAVEGGFIRTVSRHVRRFVPFKVVSSGVSTASKKVGSIKLH